MLMTHLPMVKSLIAIVTLFYLTQYRNTHISAFKEFAKSRALRATRAYVVTCLRAIRGCVLTWLRAYVVACLRAYVL